MINNIISKKIVIPIEIKVREFLPKTFLAYKIVTNSDFDVVIGAQINFTNKLIYKNCVLLDKNTRPKDRQVFSFHKNNFIAMLDEEGPISFQHKTIVEERYLLSELQKQINIFLFSGKNDLKCIDFKKIKKKSFVVGHTKFDFLKSNLEVIFKKENNFIRNKFKNFVLITGHFPSSSVRVTDYWISNVSRNILSNKKDLKKHIDSKLEFNHKRKKNYEALLNLTKKVAEQNPDITFIFRRHPLESDSFIENFFTNKPKNLKLIYKFSVTPWIYNCKFHLHSGCMSSLESIKLRKKLITYLPFYSNKFFKNYRNFHPFFTEELKCLNFFKNKKKNKKKINYKNMENISINFSNKNSYNEMLKIFKKKYKNIQSEIMYKKIEDNSLNKLIDLYLKIGSHLKTLLNKSLIMRNILAKISLQLVHTKEQKILKMKSISLREIREIFDLFFKAENKKNKVFVKKISDSTFYISKK